MLIEPNLVTSIIDHQTVKSELLQLHSRKQDFDEGDLLHRLDRFNAFVLKMLPISAINLTEFQVDQVKVQDFTLLYQDAKGCPPIIFDSIDGSIIDGIHRANALALLGIAEILAYVGEAEHADLFWVHELDTE